MSDDPGIQMLFFYLACSTSVGNRYETYSAGEMIYILREFLDGGRSLKEIGGVIKGGMNSVLQPLVDTIHAHGGEVRLNTRVESVATRNGMAVGVNLEVGERMFHSQVLDVETEKADFVIVTLPLWDLFKVMDEEAFPKWWVDWVNWIGTKVSTAWSIIYGLDEPLFDMKTFRWAPNLPESGFSGIFYPMPSYGDDVGQYQFHVSYQGHYDELPNLLNGSRSHGQTPDSGHDCHARARIDQVLPAVEGRIPVAGRTRRGVRNRPVARPGQQQTAFHEGAGIQKPVRRLEYRAGSQGHQHVCERKMCTHGHRGHLECKVAGDATVPSKADEKG